MSTPTDLENGRDPFSIDDDDTLQPPPNGSYDEFDNVNVDDEESPGTHDQLPTPEEYKARMAGSGLFATSAFAQFSPSKIAAEASEAGSVVGDDNSVAIHDQLPDVDEYKSSRSFTGGKIISRRQGMWTFFILFVIVGLITAISVPLVMKDEEREASGSSSSQSIANGSASGSGGSQAGGSGTRPPTTPRPPETAAEQTRYQKTISYLVEAGISSLASLEQDTNSPQYKAANWIANVDTYQMPLPDGIDSDAADEIIPHTRFAERYTLAVFYYATGGDNWTYGMRFLEPIDHCEWFQDFISTTGEIVRLGVSECKSIGEGFEENLVHKLDMPNNALNGDLPREIQFLHRLTHLVLPFNADLSSESSLDGVHALQYLTDLELQYCALTGVIPDWLGNLRQLTNLGLGNNVWTGTLSENFFKLTNLIQLGLDDNAVSAPISSFGALSNLESLYLEDNFVTGELTESLFSSWTKMVELDLSDNDLDGPLPFNMWSISSLQVMDIHGNSFVGPIPEIRAPVENLSFLALHENRLDWRIPDTINNLVNLAHLDVSRNNLEIPFPSTMSDLTNLRYLFTGQNPFEDHRIPAFLRGMTDLRELSMKDNNLTGEISTLLGLLTRLQVLDLDQNKLEGQIPEELGLLTGIDTLMLNRNNLNGTIPQSFANLNDLDILLLDGNEITGNADVICKTPSIALEQFVTDCGEPNPEITCSCCHLCCHDSNTTCNNFDWHVNLDPIWEYGFDRVVYSFSQELLPPEDEP